MIPRRNASHHSLASLVIAPDDHDVLHQVRSILEEHPRKGPPEDPSELCPYLFMGSLKNANNIPKLQSLGITHVLNCAGNANSKYTRSPYRHDSGIVGYLTIPADDHAEYDIMRHFEEAFTFLDNCRQSGGKALVHCNLGINRSGAICAAYIMVDQSMSLLQVISLLKRKRTLVLCNKGFRRQLVRFARQNGYLETQRSSTKYEHKAFGVDRTNTIENGSSHRTMSTSGFKPYGRSASACEVGSKTDERRFSRAKSSHSGKYEKSSHHISSSNSLQVPKPTYNGTSRPTRLSPEYSSLPRSIRMVNGSASPVGKKRPVNASHYDTEYFMDTIPEDARFVNGKDWQKHSDRLAKKDSARAMSSFGSRSFMNFRKSKSKSSEKLNNEPAEKTKDESVLSSTRPLRVYKRSITDSELYQKPTHMYRRADTVATTDITSGLDRIKIGESHGNGDSGEPELTRQHRSSSKLSLSSNFFSKLKPELWKRSSRTSLNS